MRYKALPKDSDIDPEVALLQGALALDAAGEKAEIMNDVEGLLNVAAMWLKFGETIQDLAKQSQEAAEKAESKAKEGEVVRTSVGKIDMGFQSARPEEDPIIAEEDDEVDG